MSYTIYKPQTHLDWLKARQEGIGSSEATILMGVNHYKGNTRYNLFRKKTGQEQIPQEDDNQPWETNERLWLGHMEEPTVAACFAAKTGAYILPESEGDWIAIDNEKPWRRVSPDRLYIPAGMENKMENWCICECKTSDISIDRDNIPAYWYCQIQYQMGVMGIKHGALSWKSTFPTSHHDYVLIDFNPDYFNILVNEIDNFWINNVQAGVCPEAETLEDARDIFGRTKPKIEGNILAANEDIVKMHNRLIEIKNIKKELEAEADTINETLEMTMLTGKYESIVKDDVQLAVIAPPAKKKILDLGSLKEKEPEIFAQYAENVNSITFDEEKFKAEQKELYKKFRVMPPAGEPKFKVVFPRATSNRDGHASIFSN